MSGGSRHGAANALRGRRAGRRPHQVPASAVRRAVRGAVVVPAVFAAGEQLLHNANVALLAAFGSVTMLLLVQFGGGLRRQLTAHAAFAEASLAPVLLGTAPSQPTWVDAAPLAFSFAVLFSSVISSPLATAAPGMLIGFLLPAPRSRPPKAWHPTGCWAGC